MRKMFNLLTALFAIYLAYQFLFYFFSRGHDLTYYVKSNDIDIKVREVLSIKKEVSDGYYFEISFDDVTIPFKLLNTYKKQKNIIKNVEILNGDLYKCANIIIKNTSNASDIKCYKNGIIYFYNSIKGTDIKLDELVSNATYDATLYIDDQAVVSKDKINYHHNNFIDNDSVFVSDYKGLYVFGNEITSFARFVPLYYSDQYSKPLEVANGKYYITPDYNNQHDFEQFILANISNGYIDYIYSTSSISFNSFIQGFVNNKLYLIDIDNKIQYEVDIKNKIVNQIGNENTGAQVYRDGNWSTRNINEVIDGKISFIEATSNTLDEVNYAKIINIGDINNIKYVFTLNNNKYDVYAIYEQDEKHQKNYMFSCTDINRIGIKNDRIYYIDGLYLKVFAPTFGNKTILYYPEFKYNANLNYYIY